MIYAQYWRKSETSGWQECVGDRGVFILDGRNTQSTQQEDAAAWGKRHGHDGFIIMKGESFTRSTPLDSLGIREIRSNKND